MKNIITKLLTVIAASLMLASCVKDKCTRTYTYYQPVYKTTAEVRANIKSNAARAVERPGKLFIRGNYIFLNEVDRGIHIIDNANPAAPKNVAFIDIPGNVDVAVKGNTLYADLYVDMVTIDITNPLQVSVKKIIENAFPFRRYSNGFVADSNKVIVDWERRDTTVTVDCGRNTSWWSPLACSRCFATLDANTAGGGKSSSPFGAGISGSMARFTIMNNYLYTVTTNELQVFNIFNANDPLFSNKVNVGMNIETIYPFKDRLFIGSATGMFIYGTSNATSPDKLGQFMHVRTCDPVIADDHYAYVTLRSGNQCQGFTNQLDVLNIEYINNPTLVKSYQLTNPHGLSKDGELLFICDGRDGLKVFNAASPNNITLIKQIKDIETYDVIAYNKVALVVAKDGLYQFDYSNMNDIKLLSKIVYQH